MNMNQATTTDAEVQRAEPQDAMRDKALTTAMDGLLFCIGESDEGSYIHESALPVLSALWQAAQQASTNALLVPNETDIEAAKIDYCPNNINADRLMFEDGVRWLLDWQRAQQDGVL